MFHSLTTSRVRTHIILLTCLCALGVLLLATGAHAQTTTALDVSGTGIQYGAYTGLSGADIRVTIANIVRIALGFLGIIAILLILYAGFMWMTAMGVEDRITKAKNTMKAAVIGLVIILLAFAIVSFIMSALLGAGSGAGSGSGSGGAGGGGGFGGGGSGFRPTAIRPAGAVGKRDVVVAITFNSAPTSDVSNLRANLLLEKKDGSSRSAVEFTPIVRNNVIQLVPDAPCPAPNEDRHCLEANSDYVVNVRAGLKSASATSPLTVNCGFTAVCSQDFSTGEGIGTAPPTVAISNPTNGQSVPIGEIIQVQTLLGDEYGIGSVDYFVDGAFFASDGNVTDLGGGAYSSHTSWDTAGSTPGSAVTLASRATNIDGDSTDASGVDVIPRPAHCFNGIVDFDETGPDCGGTDCGACTGSSCTSNGECASGQCLEGQCVVTPKILDVRTRDGAPGNLITITGEHFGGGVGTVTFLGDVGDDADDISAELAPCAGSWGETRIFVVVPTGAVTGPIKVTTSTAKSDATNDAFGPIIPDFVVNDIARPGICGLEPVEAKTGQTLNVSGEGFGDTQGASRVEFAEAGADCIQTQSFADGANAGLVEPWSASAIQPILPNLAYGSNGRNYLLRVTVGGESSNTACMRVIPPSAGSRPRIDFVSPVSGSAGTYMTVFGGNFGAFGTVRFSSAEGVAFGETDFPAQCALDFWNENAVTVKVPDRFTTPADSAVSLGEYQVTVVRNDGQESNAVTFSIDNSVLPPGVCRIEPDNGPVGTAVTLHGEGFGSIPFGDIASFAQEHPDAVLFNDARPIDTISLWNDGTVSTVVPDAIETGPVVVRKYSGSSFSESNAVNFTVRDCRETGGNASCETGQSCCGDGSCRPDCGVSVNAGGNAWQFSTGPIPVFPVVLENATCRIAKKPDDTTITPTPNPYRNAQDVCTDISTLTLRFSLPMDPASFTSDSVILEKCGTEDALGACEPVPSGTIGAPSLLSIELGTQSKLSIPVFGMEPSTWYRLTVTDSVTSLSGDGRSAERLDGDNDGREGGAYTTQFKTGETACIVSGVDVDPGRGLIEAVDGSASYTIDPLSNRCIILSCKGKTTEWDSSDILKATVDAGGFERCATTAWPVSETDPGPDIDIRGAIDTFTDIGKLKVDYANPRVVEYGPSNCTEACVNTLPYAVFNTEMANFGSGNVTTHARIQECANESCLAFTRAIDANIVYEPGVDAWGKKIGEPTLSFEHTGLAPNTFYRVTIEGTAESTSAVPLTGLNYEDKAFSWIFRTRTDGNPCGPQDIAVSPRQTTLRYIGQRSSVRATPKTSPDSCSETGQRLTANSFEWTWGRKWNPASTPEVFDVLPGFPEVLNRYITPTPGCTSSCLATGSSPPNTPECGNGILEQPAEACESPGIGGCSDRCLMTGNTEANGCGDGIVDASRGEECDAGAPDPNNDLAENGEAGSGCTTSCLFTGSSAGLSVCGNGSVGVGEACDDGNTVSGDGCSSVCLREGSEQNVPVCGNGILETPYEQCDYALEGGKVVRLFYAGGAIGPDALNITGMTDPNVPGFPCGTSCLFVGNRVVGDKPGSCGNGVIDYVEGENCDAGDANGTLGSGCSSDCRKTGDDIVLGAFCKDGTVTVDPVTGGGEDCDPNEGASIRSPRQVLEGLNQCDAKNDCDASVTATIGVVTGQGDVNVECSCRTDSDCSGFGADLACGAGACCYERPEPPDILPKGRDECRNTAVTVVFPGEMNIGSLTGNITVEQCGAVPIARADGNVIVRAFHAIGRFVKSLIGLDASALGDCSSVKGSFTHATVSKNGKRYTESRFAPDTVLEKGATYRVTVATGDGGVMSVNNVGYPASEIITQEFGTGDEICAFDVLQVEPSSLLIQTSDEVHGFVARPMTSHGGLLEEIAPISGVYDWSWRWSTIALGGGTSNLSLTPDNSTDPSVGVQAKTGVNGREQLIAEATILNDIFFDPPTVGDTREGKADITTLLCNNPWPRRNTLTGEWKPYEDPETHFQFYYCRDSSNGDLLPELSLVPRAGDGLLGPVEGQSGFRSDLIGFCRDTKAVGDATQLKSCRFDSDCGTGDACYKKDAFFRFIPKWKLNDAIGLRTAPNVNHLSPQRWYESQLFSGRTESLDIDGYRAIKDGRTVYVSVADKYGDPQLRSYIQVFGYNDGADPRTIEIFDQLMKNISFNTNMTGRRDVTNVCRDGTGELISNPDGGFFSCSNDLECLANVPNATADIICDADKDKLRRDMLRWEDLSTMTEELEAIRTNTGFYPRLESGSFIRGMTTSKWPSWTDLGAAAVSDPLNAFNRCETFGSVCSISKRACSSDGDCDQETVGDICKPKFEASTCYNSSSGLFMCPQGSRIYRYQAIGGIDYELQAEFEYTKYPWGGSCENKTDALSCESSIGCVFDTGAGVCRSRVNINPSCSGIFTGNACLQTGVECVDDAQCDPDNPADTCQPVGVTLFGSSVPGSEICGNGVKEATEQCEIGQEDISSCATGGFRRSVCRDDCSGYDVVQACPGEASCGNNVIESGETCDDGTENGAYGRCRSGSSLGCKKYCVRVEKRDAFTPSDDIIDSKTCLSNAECGSGFICTDRMNFCGDGVKNGPESCDDGVENGAYGKCAWDCRGQGPRCGDFEVNGSEQCDGNREVSSGVCVSDSLLVKDGDSIMGTATSCASDSDCGEGESCAICAPTDPSPPNDPGGLPQTRTKSCQSASAGADACTFASWSACKPSGACGNGTVEGNEECDEGSANSLSGSCLPTCRLNVCNDGFVLQGVEQCDNGPLNGTECSPEYGLTCNYCKNDCTIETISGAYCGDGEIQTPPSGSENCDPGPVAGWCSRTYNNLADASGAKSCFSNNGCLPGVCKNHPSGTEIEGASCHDASDCAKDQFCEGGEGACVTYGTQCIPASYSNTADPESPRYENGNCVTCSGTCFGSVVKSPFFCGDDIVQPEFGEECDGVGKLFATGPSGDGAFYGCLDDCGFDVSSGYCGDGILQNASQTHGEAELCDGSNFGGLSPTCEGEGWGVGSIACGRSCGYYGGGCSNGPLSPGDVRIKVEWDDALVSRDQDIHMILPVSAGAYEVEGYPSPYGSVIEDPHVWLSWDDRAANKGPASPGFPKDHGLEIMTFNWRDDGRYWPSNSGSPYRFYVYSWSTDGPREFYGMRVTVCTYKEGNFNNEDCSLTFNGSSQQSGSRYWYVFDAMGSDEEKPTINSVDLYGKCGCAGGSCTREEFKSCFDIAN